MAKETGKRKPRSRIAPLAVAGAGGAGLGFFTGHVVASSGSTAVLKLAEGLLSHAALTSAGSIIGSAIIGSCSVLSAIAVPLTVAWVLSRKEQ